MDMGNEVRVIEVEIDKRVVSPEIPAPTPVEAEFEDLLEEAKRLSRDS